MAVDVCSEISSLVTSPRISFSYDLHQTDSECHRRRSDQLLVDFTADFDFFITNNTLLQETSSADELFSNGKILPTEMIKKAETTKKEPRLSEPTILQHQPPVLRNSKALNVTEDTNNCKKLKEFLYEESKPVASKSFWQFKRSTSLNCDNGRSKGFIRSLQTLARSNSTGSAAISKQTVLPTKVTSQKQNSQRHPTVSTNNHQSLPTFSGYHQRYNSSGKPPMLKNCRSYSTGVKFNPVLNIPPAYVSKGTANLFGFSSFFCSGKSKKKRK